MKYLLIFCIKIYQKTLSPDHGPLKGFFPYGACKFYPTCSQYGIQAIEKHGVIKGVPMTLNRIGRCNPYSEGGIDKP